MIFKGLNFINLLILLLFLNIYYRVTNRVLQIYENAFLVFFVTYNVCILAFLSLS
jgi:hypothetical protein